MRKGNNVAFRTASLSLLFYEFIVILVTTIKPRFKSEEWRFKTTTAKK